MTAVKMCDNPQGNVNVMQKVYSLMERCDGHGEVKGGFLRCDSFQYIEV